MQETKFYNNFEATGRVVQEKNYDKGSKLITLLIKGTNGRLMYPEFICGTNLLPKSRNHINLTIKGHIANIPYEKNGETKYRQHFIAETVEPTKTLTEQAFGVKGKFFPESYMWVYLKGMVAKIKDDSSNSGYFRYHIFDGKKLIMVSMKKLERHQDVEIGDIVACVCLVSTTEKGEDGGKKKYENINISDLAIVKK